MSPIRECQVEVPAKAEVLLMRHAVRVTPGSLQILGVRRRQDAVQVACKRFLTAAMSQRIRGLLRARMAAMVLLPLRAALLLVPVLRHQLKAQRLVMRDLPVRRHLLKA